MTIDDAISRIVTRLTIQVELKDQQIAEMQQQLNDMARQITELSKEKVTGEIVPSEGPPKPDLKVVPKDEAKK